LWTLSSTLSSVSGQNAAEFHIKPLAEEDPADHQQHDDADDGTFGEAEEQVV